MNRHGTLLTATKLLVFVFGTALLLLGLMKLSDRATFLEVVQAHGLVPVWAAGGVSYFVPITETLLGIATIWAVTTSNRASAIAALGVSAMMLAMTMYAAGLWVSPPPVPASCGCIPNAAPIESWMPITIRNGTLTAVASLAARVLIQAPVETHTRSGVLASA